MLKKILLTFLLLFGMSAYGADNYLNSVVIEKVDGKNSIILRSDSVAKMKREVEASDKVVITLKGIKQSANISTLYKNTSDINGLIIQNDGNEIKIYIDAPEISKANIVFETPDSAPIVVADSKTEGFAIWTVISVLLLLFIMKSAKNITSEQQKPDLNEIIKEREKELYKNFQKEIATLPSMNYKLKSYRKHVLKGETIRSYESRFSKI